ncbi:MAG: DUF2628 domain-containing protein [Caloramator sp.]|nr:DUF2628 domain-containing protein [Caloramator sp.]
MFINLKHKETGITKRCKVGFSWTTLFFGFFVPFLRGDIKWGLLMILIGVISAGIGWLVFPFIYNKIYIRNLVSEGYIPADDYSKNELRRLGVFLE